MKNKLISSLALPAMAFLTLQLQTLSGFAATPQTWSGNYPVTGSVTIPSGVTVTLDTDVSLTNLTIDGEVICGNRNLAMSAESVIVHGLFQCGTPSVPYIKNFSLTLKGNNPSADVMGMGTKVFGTMGSGRIVLQGEKRKGWTRLATTAARRSTTITLKEAMPWRVGDRIFLASTDFRPENAEEREIVSISGKTITLNRALAKEHFCQTSTYSTMSIEECGEVGLLSRNILIRGDANSQTNGFGGHMMIMNGGTAQIAGVEFFNMGQRAKLGRYPMHWHLVGDAPGQYVNDSSFVHSYNRFVSVHGTNQVTLSGNVGFDTFGHGYYLEDGIEHGNVIENNLGAYVRSSETGPTPTDARASVFWISNPDNTIRGNAAAGGEHVGFWMGFPVHPVGLSATTSVWPQRTPLKLFDNNVSHSNGAYGLFLDGGENPDRSMGKSWYGPVANPSNPNSAVVPPLFSNFTTYKNRLEAMWMRGTSNTVVRGAKVANSRIGIYFASLSNGPSYIEGSLFVGETANKGNPEVWEITGPDGRELPHLNVRGDAIRGLEYYDGPMAVRGNVFANFNTNNFRKAGAVTNLAGNPFVISSMNTINTSTFVNTNKVWLEPLMAGRDGEAFSVILDRDGSLTGAATRRVVPKNPLLYTSSCTLKPDWNAYICPHDYVSLKIQASGSIRGTKLTRNDGATYTLTGVTPSTMHATLIENRSYNVKLPGSTIPKDITFIRWENAGEAARVSIDYPYSSFRVELEKKSLIKGTSLDDLATGGSKYFYDNATKRLHLRLISVDGLPKAFHVIHN